MGEKKEQENYEYDMQWRKFRFVEEQSKALQAFSLIGPNPLGAELSVSQAALLFDKLEEIRSNLLKSRAELGGDENLSRKP